MNSPKSVRELDRAGWRRWMAGCLNGRDAVLKKWTDPYDPLLSVRQAVGTRKIAETSAHAHSGAVVDLLVEATEQDPPDRDRLEVLLEHILVAEPRWESTSASRTENLDREVSPEDRRRAWEALRPLANDADLRQPLLVASVQWRLPCQELERGRFWSNPTQVADRPLDAFRILRELGHSVAVRAAKMVRSALLEAKVKSRHPVLLEVQGFLDSQAGGRRPPQKDSFPARWSGRVVQETP